MHDRWLVIVDEGGLSRVETYLDLVYLMVVMVTPAAARRIAQAYGQWGRGQHRAALNFGDCFAYEVAKEHACHLLFVGDDLSKTDIEAVL